MTRFVVQYLTEASSDGSSNIETVFVESSSEDSAKQLVVNRCGAFINILSVAKTKSEGGVGLIETVANTVAEAEVVEKQAKVKAPKEPKPAKVEKVKAEVVPGEKKVTASSVVRSRIVIAKDAGQTLDESVDEITLWCMSNLGMSKSTARGYVTSQWIRV
jgi:hypothetical protein